MKFKKYIAVLLAVCLVLSFGAATSFAAEPVLAEAQVETASDEVLADTAVPEIEELLVEEAPAAEEPAVSADAQAILALALTDGAGAAALLNEVADEAAYTDILRQVLDMYYSGDMSQFADFSAALDGRAAQLLAAYEGAAAERQSDELGYVPGEILVVFNGAEPASEMQSAANSANGSIRQTDALVSGDTLGLVDIALSQTVDQAVAMFEGMPDVKYAQPNFIYQAPEPINQKSVAPNDPLLEDQWYLDKIGMDTAWMLLDTVATQEPDKEKVRVVVLDTPIDMNHEDLQESLNKELCVDTSRNQLLPPYENIGTAEHGTHVSGTIAATTNNGKGVAGVANTGKNNIVDLVSVSVLGAEGNGTAYSVALGINYAISIEADVINMSLGSASARPYPDEIKLLRDMCDAAYVRGIVTVVAAGNENTQAPNTPSDFRSVISIIANKNWTDSNDAKANFSNYGTYKDFSAPGVDIANCVPFSEYDIMSGTSMASPVTAGVVAIMKYIDPKLDMEAVYSVFKDTAEDLYTGGFDIYSGWGEINAGKAVLRVVQDAANKALPKAPEGVKAVSAGYNSVKLSWKPVENANGYIIYKSEDQLEYNDFSYSKYNSVTGTGFTDTKAKPGEKSSYKVCAYVGIEPLVEEGEMSKVVSAVPVCAAPKNLNAVGTGKTTISASWGKVAGAKGYYVYRSTQKNGSYTCLGKVSANSFADKGLKSGTKYYYKVFAYNVDKNGKNLRGASAGPVAGQTK